MKWFMRGLSASLLFMGILGVLGCGTDNQTEADRLAKTIGDPGKPDPKGVPATVEPPAKDPARAIRATEAATRRDVQERQLSRQKVILGWVRGGWMQRRS